MAARQARSSAWHFIITAEACLRYWLNIHALIADNQMRQRDERFIDQGKYNAKDDGLYDDRPTV